MNQEEAAKAHIDFLIDEDVRGKLGITSRTLDTQVLRLCGGFNDLIEAVEAAEERIEMALDYLPESPNKAMGFLKGNE